MTTHTRADRRLFARLPPESAAALCHRRRPDLRRIAPPAARGLLWSEGLWASALTLAAIAIVAIANNAVRRVRGFTLFFHVRGCGSC
jgi:hypothetical protein